MSRPSQALEIEFRMHGSALKAGPGPPRKSEAALLLEF